MQVFLHDWAELRFGIDLLYCQLEDSHNQRGWAGARVGIQGGGPHDERLGTKGFLHEATTGGARTSSGRVEARTDPCPKEEEEEGGGWTGTPTT